MTDQGEIARHAGALLERGVVTSALGIGNGYDEELLGAIAEAGGGNLHDAENAPEIGEVVLGELQAGRAALVERVTLRVTVPANLRAEVVGPWANAALPGVIEVMVGSLMPEQTNRVVFRLHCPSRRFMRPPTNCRGPSGTCAPRRAHLSPRGFGDHLSRHEIPPPPSVAQAYR